jgi:transitional endoplasmic reticulum ATPase
MEDLEGIFALAPAGMERLQLQPFDVVFLTNPDQQRCVGQIVSCAVYGKEDEDVHVHPALFDFCVEEQQHQATDGVATTVPATEDQGNQRSLYRLAPSFRILVTENHRSESLWELSKPKALMEAEHTVSLTLRCIYTEFHADDEHTALKKYLQRQLADRWVTKDSITMVVDGDMCTVVVVESLVYRDNEVDSWTAVRLPVSQNLVLSLSMADCFPKHASNSPRKEMTTCPGYEVLQRECLDLLQLDGPCRPSGVLLTGCPGVGKTRMAQCMASRLEQTVHWILLGDFLLQAIGKTATEMAQAMLPASSSLSPPPDLVIVDDVDLLAVSDDARNDAEKRTVLAGLLVVMDECVQTGKTILGIATTASALPPELVKAGRFEKEIPMEAPTLQQREMILESLLRDMVGVDATQVEQWSSILASTTAGCVVADLRRICVQACTQAWARTENLDSMPAWKDMKDAAHAVVPSQLALLDVVKPVQYDGVDGNDWGRIHQECWRSLSGYEAVKKRIHRTVVLPWRRVYLSSEPAGSTLSGAIVPPSGVLFHGPSGCGKTVAAGCLASSLGLPMIQVRAADVLDKWLGGSEAMMRSLFVRARSAAPCVLFFDEIDAIATNRSTDEDTVDVMSRVLSTLLNEMDGVSTNKLAPRVLVVACTNRRDSLDAALLRPGRLDEHIKLEHHWKVDDVELILNQYLRRAPLDASLDLRLVAEKLIQEEGKTGAELEGICRSAVLRAMRRSEVGGGMTVTATDLVQDARY